MAIVKFCSECGAGVAGAKFCPECGTSTAQGVAQAETAPLVLSHDEQVVILEREIAELAKQGWHVYGRVGPYEVSLRRKSGLTARQFLPLWVEEDGSLWTNAGGVVTGGRLRDMPSLAFNPKVTLHPTLWKPAPASSSSHPSPSSAMAKPGDAYRRARRDS
jgi:hypothetical protein